MHRLEWNFSSTAEIAVGALLLTAIIAVSLFLV
jgi:hypothetical protein